MVLNGFYCKMSMDGKAKKTIGRADRIRVAPDGTRVVIMLKGIYKILEPGNAISERPLDSLGLNGDTVFWGQDYFCIPLDRPEWGKNLYSFFRTKNGTRLGIFDTTNSHLLYNSTAFKRNPTGILDKITLKVYPANLKSIIHLGGAQLKLFKEDMKMDVPKNNTQIQASEPRSRSLACLTYQLFILYVLMNSIIKLT